MTVDIKYNVKKQPPRVILSVIYARYSSHAQGEQSIEGQVSAARAYAEAKGYTVVREYIDRAMTGKNDNREQFQRMLSDTAKRHFHVIIVWKVDRFGRNREEIAINKHTCKKNGVRVEYVAENLPDTPEAIILESVLEGMAEYYSIQLSQNIMRGQLASAKKGKSIGGTCPLGYVVNPITKKYEIDPKTAPIVRTIFNKYAAGLTASEIIANLNEQGLRTARKRMFTKNSLTRLLKNEKYIGVYTYRDLVRTENAIPAIITQEVFNKVQEQLKINRRSPSHRWTQFEYLLTDKLFCGKCGSPMVGESGFSHTGAKHSYYGCTKKRREKTCTKRAVRQDWLEPLVLDQTNALLQDETLLEYIANRTWEYYLSQDQHNEKRAALKAQLLGVDNAIGNLVKAIEAGIFNEATKMRMDQLDIQKAELTASLADLELTTSFRLTREHILCFLTRFREMDLTDKEVQKRLIQMFVNSVFVFDDEIKITYNYYSNNTNTVTLAALNTAETNGGFVCCLPCSTKQNPPYDRRPSVTRWVFPLHQALKTVDL